MFPRLASWNEFVGTPTEASLDGSIMRATYNGYTRSKLLQRTYTRVQLSNGVSIMAAEIKSQHENGSYCFRIQGQIYHSVSLLYQNKANKATIWTISYFRFC
jgi:hypothetical protein